MNTHFAVATHILTFLQLQPGKAVSSETIAASVNTNSGFVRRLLSHLRRAGLTKSVMGTSGGTVLSRPGDRITLLDVYRATGAEGQIFTLHSDPNPVCPVGNNILGVLNVRLDAAEQALQDKLAKTTIADVATDIRRELATSRSGLKRR